MYVAIETKYIGPSNVRGSRIKASTDTSYMMVHYNCALSPGENHLAAAKAFASKLGWKGDWYGGSTRKGYVFVCADTDSGSQFTI